MAQALFTTEFSTVTNPVRLYYYLQSNPMAVVGTVNLPYPNVDGQATVVANLTSNLYRFEFWQVSGNSQTAIIGVPIYYKPSASGGSLTPYYYEVDAGGMNPVSGATSFSDPALQGKSYVLFEQGIGHRVPGQVQDYTPDPAGGWSLSGGNQFVSGVKYMALVGATGAAGTATIITDYNGVNIVNANVNFDDTFKGKHNVCRFANNTTGIITFPDFSLIQDCKAKFSTYGNDGRYVRLQFANGNAVPFNGGSANKIALRKNEMVELVFVAGICYVTEYRGQIEEAGQPVFATEKLLNTENADGAEYSISDYQDMLDEVPAYMKVSYADWNLQVAKTIGTFTKVYYINRGKFAVDGSGGVFKMPDLRGQSFRGLPESGTTAQTDMLTQGPGGMWAQEIMRHKHLANTTGNTNFGDPGLGLPRVKTNGDGGDPHNLITETGGNENRVDSTGYHALIRI